MTDGAPYDVRAATAGAMLARHLYQCARCDAAGEPLPTLDLECFGGADGVDRAFMAVGAMLGIYPGDERGMRRVMTVMQALAEVIVAQGAQLECDFAAIIHDEEREIIIAREAPP